MREKSSKRVHELEQPQLVAMNRFQFLPAQRFLRRPERVLRRTNHQRERRAKFVAHVAEERGLGAIQFRQRLGAPLRLFERLGGGDGGADLGRDEREKIAIRIVERQALTGTGNQNAQRMVDPLSRDRHQHDLARC